MIRRCFSLVLLLIVLIISLGPVGQVHASGDFQNNPDSVYAQQLLEKMTPEEKVGQLFLVSFTGSSADVQSQIYDLITRYHIGGVELRADNDNFVDAPDTVASAYKLIAQLQNYEWQASQNQSSNIAGTGPGTSTPTLLPAPTPVPPNYIPLFIGLAQNGDGAPNDQILNGLTPLPDLMAIGATWDPSLAQQVGAVAGQELSQLGVNLYLGPSLDVLENPQDTLTNGLDANVFGGDPYWVGVMGSAYITGLHNGSDGRMMVVADHFPGSGNADRPAGQEAATVRKSLDQLKQVELAPFFAVTGNAGSPESTTDGLLVAHVKYEGFQGIIRSTTRPVSLDPQALSQILSLPTFASWHTAGGLMVSDDLGSQTVRLFYDPGGQSFFARLVALDAFLAGNDLLTMGDIVSTDAKDNYASVISTLAYFTQKYRADTTFAKRVDDTVRRILTEKYHLYGSFNPNQVIPAETGLETLGQSAAITIDVAREAATLVSPDLSDLDTILPNPPVVNDHIVFLSDARTVKQCSTCADQPMLATDALQKAILQLYGYSAGGQVIAGRLISYSLDSVSGILSGGAGNQDLETSIVQANWVVIDMLDAPPDQPQTVILKRFLSERQDILRDKHIIVFAFNAPIFLDATDISKVTAYYCLYGKSEPFVETAARLLFRELAPSGTLPVSVAGIGYDMHDATSPDSTQVIGLSLDLPSSPTPTAGTLTPAEPTSTPFFKVGDTFSTRTGTIIDHNGHPVPDGTNVVFRIAMNGTGGFVQQIASTTIGGVARASFSIDRPGLLEISASSAPAISSVVLQLNVTNEGSSITIVTPTPVPEFTPTATLIVPTPVAVVSTPPEQRYPNFSSWLVVVLTLFIFGFVSYWAGYRIVAALWGVRWAICVILGGLLAYTYLATNLPGASVYIQKGGWSGMLGLVLLSGAAGFGVGYAWFRLTNGSTKRSN